MEKWNSMTLSIVYGNLAKAAEKQQDYELADTHTGQTGLYREKAAAELTAAGSGTLEDLGASVKKDLEETVPAAFEEARRGGDRAALRALTWGEKVAKIEKSLIDRYVKQGDALLEGKDLFVCQACGFIFLGNTAPEICPVCKAPSSRFSKIL